VLAGTIALGFELVWVHRASGFDNLSIPFPKLRGKRVQVFWDAGIRLRPENCLGEQLNGRDHISVVKDDPGHHLHRFDEIGTDARRQ
jgi:hypothetical protein